MTTSGVTNSEFPADFVIQEAYERTGRDPQGLTGWQIQSGLNSLNLMFLNWQNQNVLEWNMDQQLASLADGARYFDTTPGTVAVLSAYLRRDSIDTALLPIARDQYDALPDKDTQGFPDRYWTYRTAGADPRVFLWQCSDRATDQVYYWRIKRTDDVITLAETLDTVDRWLDAVTASLAVRLWEKLPIEVIKTLGGAYNNKTIELATAAKEKLYFAQTEDRTKASMFALPVDYVSGDI